MYFSLALIAVTVLLVALIDYIPRLIIKNKTPIPIKRNNKPAPNFLIMPTVYGDISYLQNTSFLKKYAHNVVICTSRYETKEFYRQLRSVCREYGFRYIAVDLPSTRKGHNKNAYTIYKGVFNRYRQLGITKETPCILIDADTYAQRSIKSLVKTFCDAGLDISSLRCEAANPRTAVQKLQAFEYRLAMDNRRMDPWLTSGACNLAKAGVYKKVFNYHSEFFAGGDIEIGKLARIMGYDVGHINFSFYTKVPDSLRDWYNQRIIWFAGGFRHHVTNIASYGWHHFFMLFYNTLIVYLLFPLRWVEILNFPFTLGLVIVVSWLYTYILISHVGWKKEYLLLPFYSAFQTMIVIPVAVARYIKLSWNQKSVGLLRYDISHNTLRYRRMAFSLNIASAVMIIGLAVYFTALRVEYWANNDSGYLTQVVRLVSLQ